ncbi:rod shape-determining protein MreC [bacterium]|nr:rod shape-determining protein MreC [bacterium]
MASFPKPSGLQRPEDRTARRRRLLFFLAIAVIIAIFKTHTLITGRTNPVDQAITRVVSPLVQAIKYTGDGLASLRYVFGIPALLRENSRLNRENEFLRRRLAENEHLGEENKRLHALLKLNVPQGFTGVPAVVTARPYDLWLESAMLNVGAKDGVRSGDLVVNENGVAGVIDEVQPGFCWVQLIVSPQARLAAITGESRSEGIIRGVGSHFLELMYVKAGSPVETGEKVFTRGEAGVSAEQSSRPRGQYIGVIVEKKVDSSGFLSIKVEPAVNASNLGTVVVMTR